MTARDHMSLPTEFAVCDALIALAVTGNDRQAEASIVALYELGYDECARHLDEALSARRELSATADDHSVKVESLADRVIAYVAVRDNGNGQGA